MADALELDEIWLEPKCAEDSPEGRSWCDHDAWGACDECQLAPVRYIRADAIEAQAAELAAAKAEVARLRADLREAAMQSLADMGQAKDAYDAQLRAEAEVVRLRDETDTLRAKLDATLKDRAFILSERDKTFALMLARAERAEGLLALSDASKGLRIKPLEWRSPSEAYPWYIARMSWGNYYVQFDDETRAWFASLEIGDYDPPEIISPSDVASHEAAQAAAQADYESRILAAIDLDASGGKLGGSDAA